MEKYYKVHKEMAARGGFNDTLRQEVDGDYLMLSEKDIRMISLTVEEKVAALGASEVTEEDIEGLTPEDDTSGEEITDDEDVEQEITEE